MGEERVLTFGEPLLVFAPETSGPFVTVEHFALRVAGAELNTAVGLARLGLSVAFGGAVGHDAPGDRIRRALGSEGVDAEWLERADQGSTPLFLKERSGLTPKTAVFYYRSQSPMATGHWDGRSLEDTVRAGAFRWVHSTGITWAVGERSAVRATSLLRAAKAKGAVVSFDVNMRVKLAAAPVWREIVRTVLSDVDWLFLSDEESSALFGEDTAPGVDRAVRQLGFAGTGVVVKRGAEGAEAIVAGERHVVSPFPVALVDSVGAGDGFNAGFIAGMMRGWELPEAFRLAALVGAYAVTVVGDYDGYPFWDQAQRELQGVSGGLR